MVARNTYVPLWVKSYYSFLEGVSSPEALVEQAHALGLPALALTDRHGVYGLVRAHLRAKALGIKLLVGAELSVQIARQEAPVDASQDRSMQGRRSVRSKNSNKEGVASYRAPEHALRMHRLVALAPTRQAYAQLCQLLTKGHRHGLKGECWLTLEELTQNASDLILLCPGAPLLAKLDPQACAGLYGLCVRHLRTDDKTDEQRLRQAAQRLGVKLVGGTEVLYHDPVLRPLQDIVTCIRHKCTLTTAGRRIAVNAEHALRTSELMAQRFADAPELLTLTQHIATACTFSLTELRYRYPAEKVPYGYSDLDWLRELTLRGATKRYAGDIPENVCKQLEHELDLIAKLDYGGYFLTMHEIVEYCNAKGILCQGRGSAANSAVCYCLGITAIDPVRMELLFERFISQERAEPPDIDLDIEHERREEVIQHVYATYGRRNAAMVANVVRYRARSAVRDIGKVLDIQQGDLDGLARLMVHYSAEVDAHHVQMAGLDAQAPVFRQLLYWTQHLLDAPRHLSIHPGGFLLGHEPVDSIVPIEPATMPGRTVIQWDKNDIEDLGLFKVDLLGLGSLSCIRRCFALLHQDKGIALTLPEVPAEDAATYAMIAAGDTMGVFQIESRAQMSMLPRLRPQTFYDLVIEVAIVRPGPIQGDMVHPYLRRRVGIEPIEYPHKSLEKVLYKTLGIPIFQEQVMKLAVSVAGYTPGEADQLRRDMAAWHYKGRMELHQERFISRMVERGIPLNFAERVFSQIKGFGEYGFPESHAASFALLAYITSWIKCHHPDVFLCAMLNSQPMGFYAPSTLIAQAQRQGVEVLPIDVCFSTWDCRLESISGKWAVRMGLRYLKGFGTAERKCLEAIAPTQWASLEQFIYTTQLPLIKLLNLAKAGAFESFGFNRRDAIWAVRGLAAHSQDPLQEVVPRSRTQFSRTSTDEDVAWDYRASGHSTRGHPMAEIRKQLADPALYTAHQIPALANKQAIDYLGMVICRQRPQTASGVCFFTLEDETGTVNVVVWPQVFEKHAHIVRVASLLGVSGTLQHAEGVTHLVAQHLWIPELTPAATPASRNFH